MLDVAAVAAELLVALEWSVEESFAVGELDAADAETGAELELVAALDSEAGLELLESDDEDCACSSVFD
ncbi:MAG: hypothetical protein ABF586_13275 [Sporolactobacillus sp.]